MPDLYSDDFAVQNGRYISAEAFFSGFFSQITIESEKKVVISSPLKRNYSYNEATVRTRKTTVRLGRCLITALFTGESFNGRTVGFDPTNAGPAPAFPTILSNDKNIN